MPESIVPALGNAERYARAHSIHPFAADAWVLMLKGKAMDSGAEVATLVAFIFGGANVFLQSGQS